MNLLLVWALVYLGLVLGATFALWHTGVLGRLPPAPTVLVIGAALGLAGGLVALMKLR